MKHPSIHARLLLLLCLLLVGIPVLLAGCGVLLASPSNSQTAEAFDRIVPGMTRAEDLAQLGIELGNNQALAGAQVAQRFTTADPQAQACVQAGLYCIGYVLPSAPAARLLSPILGKAKASQMVLLVMNGRVIDKVLSDGAPPPGLRVASATAF
jgi:hypothetical protein